MGVKVRGTVQGGPKGKRGNWGWELNVICRLLVLRKQQLHIAIRLSDIQNVQRFQNRPVQKFYGLKTSQMRKVRASSDEYPDVEKIKNLRRSGIQQAIWGYSTKRLQWSMSKLNSSVKYSDSFICFSLCSILLELVAHIGPQSLSCSFWNWRSKYLKLCA